MAAILSRPQCVNSHHSPDDHFPVESEDRGIPVLSRRAGSSLCVQQAHLPSGNPGTVRPLPHDGHRHVSCHASLTHSNGTWWRHQVETFSASLALCAGNSSVTGEFPLTKASDAELMFLISAWTIGWVNHREAGNLRHHRAHLTSLWWNCYYLTIFSALDLPEVVILTTTVAAIGGKFVNMKTFPFQKCVIVTWVIAESMYAFGDDSRDDNAYVYVFRYVMIKGRWTIIRHSQ